MEEKENKRIIKTGIRAYVIKCPSCEFEFILFGVADDQMYELKSCPYCPYCASKLKKDKVKDEKIQT